MNVNKHQCRSDHCPAAQLNWEEDQPQTIRTWHERIGATADFPLHAPTDVERAMEAEIADLRAHADPASAGLVRIGGQMANVIYNLAQQSGRPVAASECEVMDKLRNERDAARGQVGAAS